MDTADLTEQAKTVLANNDKDGKYTIPAAGLYPHQWLWDSCFIAIGMSHFDVDRAKTEILSLMRGQWANGMMPHMIFSNDLAHRQDSNIWRSWVNPFAPDDVKTSGITQPPLLAEAIVKIGKKLSLPERRSWYQTVYPALIAYHQWLYTERDPHNEGLVLQIHPWETGLDNTPSWMYELHEHQLSWWIHAIGALHLEPVINLFRRDTRFVPPEQRLSAVDALALFSVQRRLRRKGYNIQRILTHSLFAIEDAGYNAILIRANTHLKNIAKAIGKKVPQDLADSMKKTEEAYEQLWDAYANQYFSRNFVTHKPIKVPTIATLLPLYGGKITKERAEQLVQHLLKASEYKSSFPIPSVPLSSEWFNEFDYWQGPSWVNTNWLVIQGLRHYGYDDLADSITKTTLDMVSKSGFYEYFSPLSGEPAGIPHFSWTAALTIDLLQK